jgi:hypothetical protein
MVTRSVGAGTPVMNYSQSFHLRTARLGDITIIDYQYRSITETAFDLTDVTMKQKITF